MRMLLIFYVFSFFICTFDSKAGTLGVLTYELSGDEITITDCEQSASGELVIPEIIIGSPVVCIGYAAFSHCANLTNITIPDSVTTIEQQAFQSCDGLSHVTCPESLQIIGSSTFSHCTNLKSITLNEGLHSIGGSAFNECENLMGITIPDGMTSIGQYAFNGCDNLVMVAFDGEAPNSVDFRAFKNAGGLDIVRAYHREGITIDSSNVPLYSFRIGGIWENELGYELYERQAFIDKCSRILSGELIIPNSIEGYPVTRISIGALQQCDIMTVTIPDNVISIEPVAFASSSLTSVTVGNGLTAIENAAFIGCTDLVNFSFGNSSPTIGESAFYGCGLRNLVIPDGVEAIGEGVFGKCLDLSDVRIGNSVTNIGEEAFRECSKLKNLTLGSGVSVIGKNAFRECSLLKNVVIPDGVEEILNYAFYKCSGLEVLIIGNGVTSIGWCAFTECSNLKTLIIPDSVVTIKQAAFSRCSRLESLTIGRNVSSIGPASFYNCTSLTSLVLPDNLLSVGNEAFEGCADLESLMLGGNVESIGYDVFRGCESLSYVTMPSSLISIGNRAFQDCDDLSLVTFEGDAPNTFGSDVFKNVDTGFIIYFHYGSSGFTTPEWNGYPCEMLLCFDGWAEAYPEGLRNPADIPDGDGIPNLLKYATGLSAGIKYATSNLLAISSDTSPNSSFAIFYYKDPEVSDVILYPVASTSLTVGEATWSTNNISMFDTGNRDASGREIWQATLPGENTNEFVRLRAELK